MELTEASNLAQELMQRYGLTEWSFFFNRNKRRLGVCRQHAKTIELSEHYVVRNSLHHVRDTILHEIAHALVGTDHGHDEVWRAKCLELGCAPRACDNAAAMPVGEWQATCPGCRELFNRHRKPRNLRSLYCLACGPDKGKLIFASPRASYNRRIERAVKRPEAVQLMLNLF